MSTIRAICPYCGEVQLRESDIKGRVDDEDRGSYSFLCPQCGRAITKDASPTILKLLRNGGSRIYGRPIPDVDVTLPRLELFLPVETGTKGSLTITRKDHDTWTIEFGEPPEEAPVT